jgi:hypothetical protein
MFLFYFEISMISKLLNPIKILYTWRYWPMELLYLPLTLYIFFIGAFRAKRLFYFAAANPGVCLGGFAGDSKYNIIKKIPEKLRPLSFLVLKSDENSISLTERLISENIKFPLIVKPDIGEGGFLVEKIYTICELHQYHCKHNMDYIVQNYIDDPLEFSVLIHNAKNKITVSSVTERKYLTLTGDGTSTVNDLLSQNSNTRFRQKKIKKVLKDKLNLLIEKDKIFQPISIGNWDYGATYIDKSEIINEEFTSVFNKINTQIGLFNYARFDVKCKSVSDLLQGKFSILEINGVKGEPIHIYDIKTTLFKAYKEIFRHWEFIMIISKRNIKSGVICPGFVEGFKILFNHYKTKKQSFKQRMQ